MNSIEKGLIGLIIGSEPDVRVAVVCLWRVNGENGPHGYVAVLKGNQASNYSQEKLSCAESWNVLPYFIKSFKYISHGYTSEI